MHEKNNSRRVSLFTMLKLAGDHQGNARQAAVRAFLLVLVAEARGARVVPAPRLLFDRVVVEGIDTLCVREHRRALRSGRQG